MLALTLTPLVALGGTIAISAVMQEGGLGSEIASLTAFGIVFVVCGSVALGVRQTASHWGLDAQGSYSRVGVWARYVSHLVPILGAAPLVIWALYIVAVALKHHPILGPDPMSAFVSMGLPAAYSLPIVVTAAALIGYALRDRESGFAFAAGLLLNLAATAAFLLGLATRGVQLDRIQWLHVTQLNAVVSACYALAWLALAWLAARRRQGVDSAAPDGMLITQVALPVAINLLMIFPATVVLALNPGQAGLLSEVAGWQGWVALALGGAALFTLLRQSGLGENLTIGGFSIMLFTAGSMLALLAGRWDTFNWLAHHCLLLSQTLVAWAVFAVGALGWPVRNSPARGLTQSPESAATGGVAAARRPISTRAARYWTSFMAWLAVAIAVRAAFGDPWAPWTSVAALVAVAVLFASLACWSRRRLFVYAAGLMLNIAVTIWWDLNTALFRGSGLAHLFYLNIIVLALAAVAGLLLERRWIRGGALGPVRQPAPFHRVVAWGSLVAMAVAIALDLAGDAAGNPAAIDYRLAWAAQILTGVAVAACLWDLEAKHAMSGLYAWGLLALGMTLAALDLQPTWLMRMATMFAAAYTLLTSYLWSRRRGLLRLAERLRIAIDEAEPFAGLEWLLPANCAVGALVIASSFVMVLTLQDFSWRLWGSQACMAQAFSLGLLARGERRTPLQFGSLLVGVLGAVAFGWVFLAPGESVLNRSVVVLTALAAMTALYGIGFSKVLRQENEWTRAAVRIGAGVGCRFRDLRAVRAGGRAADVRCRGGGFHCHARARGRDRGAFGSVLR